MSIFNVDTQELIEKASDKLKEDIIMPEWANYVKTGVAKERPPELDNWYHMRAASILRKVYLFGPVGTNKLRAKFSSKKNRGFKPEKTYDAGGKIIRSILQQLEEKEYIMKGEKGVHKGRVITPKGMKFLDSTAKDLGK
jgi:small subunit ribosomal protein S19e